MHALLWADILRRIMEDYFGYNIVYHTNITDIDDKVINRLHFSQSKHAPSSPRSLCVRAATN